MPRVRRKGHGRHAIDEKAASEQLWLVGADGDEESLDLVRRYCRVHGFDKELLGYEIEHAAIVRSSMTWDEWEHGGRAQWRRGSVVTK